jgi:hypothetical protein
MRRLAFIKYLYTRGVEQSRQEMPAKTAALLTLQDAVELFLVLACEHAGSAVVSNTNFDRYFQLLAAAPSPTTLEEQASMVRLNKARVGLKHFGNWPAAASVEGFALSVESFFGLNCPLVFGVQFNTVSLVDLVADLEVRASLTAAADALEGAQGPKAMIHVSKAFYLLRRNWRAGLKRGQGEAPHVYLTRHLAEPAGRDPDFARFAAGMKQVLLTIGEELDVINMGLDFERYKYFWWMSYGVGEGKDGEVHVSVDPSCPGVDETRFLYEFVLESALRLQGQGSV